MKPQPLKTEFTNNMSTLLIFLHSSKFLNLIVGTADGHILVFSVPTKGPAVKLQETLDEHSCSICDIAADGDRMATSDESGKIILWKAGGHFVKLIEINGYG